MYYEPTVTSRLPFPANQTSHFREPQTATQIQKTWSQRRYIERWTARRKNAAICESHKLKYSPWSGHHASGSTLSLENGGSNSVGLPRNRPWPGHRKIIDRALIAACRAA